MKRQEFVQVKGLDLKELGVKAKALRAEIANLTLDKNMKKLKDLKITSKKKKELAQVLTVLRQKEELLVLSGQLSDKGQSVVGESVTEKQKTDNSKKGAKK